MTDAINFFQSLNVFGLFSNSKIDNSSKRKLSRELIKDARKFVADAETEAKSASEAKNLTLSAADRNLKQNLANIAVWHHEISAKNYRQAAARYDEASRLRADQKEILQFHSQKNMRLAEDTEQTAEFLRGLNN